MILRQFQGHFHGKLGGSRGEIENLIIIIISPEYCSPTRSAIQSGRNPIHVNVYNLMEGHHNPDDPVSGFNEMSRNMTGIAEHMLRAGYQTHMYGKWHAGDATPQHLPHGRGYESSLVYPVVIINWVHYLGPPGPSTS